MARPPALRSPGLGSPLDRRRPQLAGRPIAAVDWREGRLNPLRPRFPSLSVFFPAYNDAPSLPKLIAKTFQVLEEYVDDFEVIVVNDGSRDDTGKVLEG